MERGLEKIRSRGTTATLRGIVRIREGILIVIGLCCTATPGIISCIRTRIVKEFFCGDSLAQ